MGVGMDLEFEKYCKVDKSPRTVLQSSHQHSRHENKSRKSKSSSKNSQMSLEAGFKEIKFRNYHRSVSCKTLPVQNNELAVDREVLKRGSVYQSSKDRKSVKKPDNFGERKKIELSLSGNSPFSFSLLDSICGSDDEEEGACSTTNKSRVKFDDRQSSCSRPAERDLIENSKFKSNEVVGPSSNANMLMEDDRKSLSSKLALPHSPTRSYRSSVSRLTPIRKMLDPLTKSKSHKSPLTIQKSLLHDISTAVSSVTKIHEQIVDDLCLPAYLHGDLKLEHKNGVPYFELTFGNLENVLVAKTENALNCSYAFYSVMSRKKSNANGLGVYNDKESHMVGQMKVSCHLCSEFKEGKAFSNSVITEFVLYDVAEPHASNEVKCHEIAAIVIQVPFDLSLAEQKPKANMDSSTSTRICVAIPSGNHSMPKCESKVRPLPLLDRWRLGGGCDCGGWDMSCPLTVFDNLSAHCKQENHSLFQDDRPFALYVQGAKEKNAALTIKFTQKGQYSVEFHAKLSALQALSICVAVLHTTEGWFEMDQEKKRQQVLQKESEEHTPSFVINPPFSPIARV